MMRWFEYKFPKELQLNNYEIGTFGAFSLYSNVYNSIVGPKQLFHSDLCLRFLIFSMRSSFVHFWVELKIQWQWCVPHTHSSMVSSFILWPMDTFTKNCYIQFSSEFLWVVFQRAHMYSFAYSLRVANTHEYHFTCIEQHVSQKYTIYRALCSSSNHTFLLKCWRSWIV